MKAFFFAIALLTSLLMAVDAKADSSHPQNELISASQSPTHNARLIEVTDVYGHTMSEAQEALLSADIQSALEEIKICKSAVLSTDSQGTEKYDFLDEKKNLVFEVLGETLGSSRGVFPVTQFEVEPVDKNQTLVHVHFGESNRQIVATMSLTKKN